MKGNGYKRCDNVVSTSDVYIHPNSQLRMPYSVSQMNEGECHLRLEMWAHQCNAEWLLLKGDPFLQAIGLHYQ
jgi:hypothetical protein